MQTYISTKHRKIILPMRNDVANLIPSARKILSNGKLWLAVHHGIEETKLLRNLGVEVSAPIMSQYDWAGDTPFDSQKHTAALLTSNSRAYCLSSMGVGKTRAGLYAFDYLKKQGLVSNCLVVAPLSTLTSVWDAEIFGTFHDLRSVVLHGTREQRLRKLNEDADIYIINHDGVKTITNKARSGQWGGIVGDKVFDVIIIDELALYRNKRTNRWKYLKPLVSRAKYSWGLTGSPTPNAPTDAYGQIMMLTPNNLGSSFRRFQQQTMTQVSQFKWVPKRDAAQIVYSLMQPSVRYTLDQCHDLPPITYSTRQIEPTAQQKKAYAELLKTYAMELRGQKLTVVNEGARLNKLLQVSCGFAYDSEGKGNYIGAKDRLLEVLSIVEEADAKVIVFAPYKWAVRMIHHVISSKAKDPTYAAMITGDTSVPERNTILAGFKSKSNPQVLVAHPGTMSHGLTLVSANVIVWYAPTHSMETYQQANARIHRPGQTLHTHIIHIKSTDVEQRVYARLQRKERLQGILLGLFEKDGD